MDDIFEPRFHKAWNEALLKEQKIRVKWLEEYRVKQEAAAEDEEKLDVIDDSLETTRHKRSPGTDWPREGATGTATIIRVVDTPTQMKPPSPIVKSKLFEGTSRDGHGRSGYLKRRYQENPKDKYYDHICTSWKYGWNQYLENELSCKKNPSQCSIRKTAFKDP